MSPALKMSFVCYRPGFSVMRNYCFAEFKVSLLKTNGAASLRELQQII